MPTTKPRYTFTDAGELEELLDAAQHTWPEIRDRKTLLLRLAQEGGAALGLARKSEEAAERRRRAAEALKRLSSVVDVDVLLSDEAWR